jgi:hypothetical protein
MVFFSCYDLTYPLYGMINPKILLYVKACALTSTPLIIPPNFDKDFILYISTSPFVVTRVLV